MAPQSSSGRLIAVGDIHGHVDALKRLLDEIEPERSDTIVPLGDYVNRGPDSPGVIETLVQLASTCYLVPILGNHDEMMLDARHDRFARDRFRYDGGDRTIDSYGGDLANAPESHWEFLQSCRPYFELEQFIFTHANYDRWLPMAEQPASLDLARRRRARTASKRQNTDSGPHAGRAGS